AACPSSTGAPPALAPRPSSYPPLPRYLKEVCDPFLRPPDQAAEYNFFRPLEPARRRGESRTDSRLPTPLRTPSLLLSSLPSAYRPGEETMAQSGIENLVIVGSGPAAWTAAIYAARANLFPLVYE